MSEEVARCFDSAWMERCGRIVITSVARRAMVTNKETICIFGCGISELILSIIKVEIGYMDF